MKNTKCIRFAHLVFFATFILLKQQDTFAQSVILHIDILSSEPVFCTYGMARLNIKYVSNNDSIPFRIIHGSTGVEIKTDNINWQLAHIDGVNVIDTGTRNYSESYSGELLNLNFDFFPLFFENPVEYKNLYDNGGNVLIRIKSSIYIDSLWNYTDVYSDSISIYLPPFSAEETGAFNFLLQKKHEAHGLVRITTQECGGGLNALSVPIYKQLINTYNHSILAGFAKIWIAALDCDNADIEPIPSVRRDEIQSAFNQASQSQVTQLSKFSKYIIDCINN